MIFFFLSLFSTIGKYQELKNGTIPPFKESAWGKQNKNSIGKSGSKKLDDNFVYTQKQKNIWNSFCIFLDERFAEEDLSGILDSDEIARLRISSAISPLLELIPSNVKDVESARIRAQAFADKSYASKEESARLDGLKKLKQKFNRAIVLVLKHVNVQINLYLHRFLKSGPIKKLRTPWRTVSTQRTSAQPSTTRQRTEDHPSGCTVSIPTRSA